MVERITTLQEQIVQREQWQCSGEELNMRICYWVFRWAYLAATHCFDSIPVSSLMLSFGRLSNMDFNPSYFFILFYNKAQGKAILFVHNGLLLHTLPQQTLRTPLKFPYDAYFF